MKKLTLSRLALLFLSVLTLSACVGSTLPAPVSPSKSAVKGTVKKHKAAKTRPLKVTNAKGANYGISLNDFSDLNLPNDGDTRSNIWGKLAEGFKITNPESHPEVQQQIRWFLNHPDYLRRTTERARPYMYIVYNEVKKRGLPTELVLLPINESGYYPFSYSTAGATGIWQLMPGTASNFGLKQDFWYDGRRDIFDSTNAALDYLTYLANYFNDDWLIAIAAYDTGEGNVQNAIARNVRDGLPTDFWSLKLPAETRAYVPRLLAIAAIIEHPDRYPIPLPSIEDKPVVAQVRLSKQMKIADVARLSGLSVNQVKVLNPGLSRLATDPSLDAKVMLPIDSIDDFKQSLQATPIAAPTLLRYKLVKGDTLPHLASRFGVSVDDIKQANSNLGMHMAVGQEILVPANSENFKPNPLINLDQANLVIPSSETAPVAEAATPVGTTPPVIATAPVAAVVKTTQLVKDQDQDQDDEPQVDQKPVKSRAMPTEKTSSKTVKKSTATHGKDNAKDAAKDTTKASNRQKASSTKASATASSKGHKDVVKHKIKAGETLGSIAAKSHVTVKQLKQWNPAAAKGTLTPGDTLIVANG